MNAEQEWTALIQESGALLRQLGVKPWQFRPWAHLANPYPPGPEHDAFERVRRRGVEIDERKEQLRLVLDAEVEQRQRAAAEEFSQIMRGAK